MSRSTKIVVKDGKPLAVLRPADPALALRLAESLIGKKGPEVDEAWGRILSAQPYKFVGWAAKPSAVRTALGKRPQIVDENGNVIDELRVGDSFVVGEMVDGVPKLVTTPNLQLANPDEGQPA